MLAKFLIWYRWIFKPKFNGWIFKLLYSNSKIKVGKNFTCDKIPDLFMTENGTLTIGDNVFMRRHADIRVHKNAKIIIGNNVKFDKGVRLLATNDATIQLGDGMGIGLHSVLNGGDSIILGKKVMLSGFVYLQTSMHKFEKGIPVRDQGFNHAPVILEDDVWLGSHVVVLPGVTIGKGSVVGSNAVVNKSIEAGVVVGGIPATFLKERT